MSNLKSFLEKGIFVEYLNFVEREIDKKECSFINFRNYERVAMDLAERAELKKKDVWMDVAARLAKVIYRTKETYLAARPVVGEYGANREDIEHYELLGIYTFNIAIDEERLKKSIKKVINSLTNSDFIVK